MLIWSVTGAATAVAIAWIAALVHLSGYAPVGILSLGVGVALGATLSGIAATGHRPQGGRVADGRRLVLGAILLALVTVLAEHAWLYRDFRRQWHEARANSPEVAMFRSESPWSPAEYIARELTPRSAALWSLDAALMTAAAVGAVLGLRRDHK